VLAERAEHRVRDVADAGLQRQELARDAAGAELGGEELRHVLADAPRLRRRRGERARLVGQRGAHDAGHLARVEHDERRADAVGGVVDGDLLARGRVPRLEDVVHPEEARRVRRVQLDEDALRARAERGRRADRRREHEPAAGRDVARLHDRPVDGPEEAVAHVLRQEREVHVEEAHLPLVDERAEPGVGLVRRAEADRLGFGERSVERGSGRGAGDDADRERTAGGVLRLRALRDRARDRLGRPGGREPAESDGLPVAHERGGLFGGELGERRHAGPPRGLRPNDDDARRRRPGQRGRAWNRRSDRSAWRSSFSMRNPARSTLRSVCRFG
jgi:hypothetical protein